MILSKKIRLKPTKEQEKMLYKSAGTARFIYNWALNKQEENFKLGNKFISDNDLRKEITILKKSELIWLNEVSNNVAKQAVKDLVKAYLSFFKIQKKGQKYTKETLIKCKKQKRKPELRDLNGYPKFKSKKKSKLSFYNDCVKLKFKQNLVLIEKVGWIKCNESLVNQKFTNPRISFDGKYWYLSVGVEQTKEKEELNDVSLGIDLGIKDTAILSNGKKYKNINKKVNVKKTKKRLKRLQKQVSRKYENNREGNRYHKTANIVKLEKQIRLLHRRLANIRLNYNHQITTEIVKTKPSQIVIEDLNIKGMMKNRHLSKAIAEQSLYQFTQLLTYKCELYGIKLVKANRWFPSSKTCSECGCVKHDLKLSDRVYKCEECGSEINRDLNAAINLSNYKYS